MTAKFDIDGLIRATELSFQILQPFYEIQPRKSQSDAATQTLERIKVLTDAYIRAIKHSLDCSDRGIDICRDILVLHQFLEEKKSREYLLPFLEEVQAKAGEAHADAKVMADEFFAVQTGLFDICNSIPDLPPDFASRRQWMRTVAELAGRFKTICPKDYGLGFSLTLATALAPAHPLLLIIIPLVTSLVMLALRAAASYIEKKLLKKLEVDNLFTLQEQVSKFVEWWSDMEEKIVTIKEAYLQAGREEAMARLAKPSWTELQDLYTCYNDQIRKIRDSYLCKSETPAKPASYHTQTRKRVPLGPMNRGVLVHGLVQACWLGY